jgi:hypothetical protein
MNILSSPTADNLVSRVPGSASTAHDMSTGSAVGDGAGTTAKEGEKELAMVDVTRRLHAIEDMMRPLVTLRDQVAAIEMTIAEQGQQQQLMNAGLLHAERALRAQENGRPPNGRCHDDEEDDGFPTPHKMEFLKFDSVGDPMSWLNRCERYFRARCTLKNRRVAYASFYLTDDAQLWYHRLSSTPAAAVAALRLADEQTIRAATDRQPNR